VSEVFRSDGGSNPPRSTIPIFDMAVERHQSGERPLYPGLIGFRRAKEVKTLSALI